MQSGLKSSDRLLETMTLITLAPPDAAAGFLHLEEERFKGGKLVTAIEVDETDSVGAINTCQVILAHHALVMITRSARFP